jgi:hypothetical protein
MLDTYRHFDTCSRKISFPPEFEPWTVQHAATRYTHYAIHVQYMDHFTSIHPGHDISSAIPADNSDYSARFFRIKLSSPEYLRYGPISIAFCRTVT